MTVALYDDQGNIVATATTDPNGEYSFPGLPDGTYSVDVTDENNVLDGAWHSLGTPDTDGESKLNSANPTRKAINPNISAGKAIKIRTK